MSGTIVADSGNIGGFSIGEDSITGGTLVLRKDGRISNTNFSISSAGNITATGTSHQIGGTITANVINATGSGVIGGFTLDSVGIKSSAGTLILSGSGQITASAADISGKITANSGQIATFSITSGSIESSANSKRGLKLEPGDSIRGYGNAVHTTETVQGKFSFVEGATISPPAGTTLRWSTDLSVAAAPVERSTN
jgi:hypothetical protein